VLPAAADFTGVTTFVVIGAKLVRGRCLSTLGHEGAVVGASSQRSQPSFN